MSRDVLLCCDLDRTVLPNGPQEESPRARPLFRKVAEHPELTLAYVSGRHKALLQEAIEQFSLPTPDFAIGDVGTTIYEVDGGEWRPWEAWSTEIAPDWQGHTHDELAALFSDMDTLELQEPEKQNTFKLSYYAPEDTDYDALLEQMQRRLGAGDIRASIIWSVDEVAHTGLLDVLPASATKLHAVRFLVKENGFDLENTVFAGDSGNDLPVLTSELQAVLVANARDEVREQARRGARESHWENRLYLARGGLLAMNGNYCAGVLEGLVHFIPETRRWMDNG